MSAESAAFTALEAIQSGEWDRYLLRLRAAIEARRQTADYRRHIIAGNPPPRTPEMEQAGQEWVWLNDQWEVRGTGFRG